MPSASLGPLLSSASVKPSQVYLATIIRLGWFLPLLALFIADNTMVEIVVLVVLAAPIVLWPLRHLQDRIDFHQHGFSWRGRAWICPPAQARFHIIQPHAWCWLRQTKLRASAKTFDLSYLQNPMDAYHQAYNQQQLHHEIRTY